MVKIKFSPTSNSSASENAQTVATTTIKADSKLKSFIEAATSEASSWGGYVTDSHVESYNANTYYDDEKDPEHKHPLHDVEYKIVGVPGISESGFSSFQGAKNRLSTYISGKQSDYNSYKNSISDEVAPFISKIYTFIDKLVNLFPAFQNAIDTFESTSVSLKDALEKLAADGQLNMNGISFAEVTFEDGTIDKIMFTFTDNKGNKVTISLAEALNAFYTYTGSAVSSTVAYYGVLDEIDPAKADRKLADNLIKTINFIGDTAQKGLFGLASSSSISAFYNSLIVDNEELSGDIYSDYASVLTKLEEALPSDKFAELLAMFKGEGVNCAMAAGGMTIAAAVQIHEDFPLKREMTKEEEEVVDKVIEENEKWKEEQENSLEVEVDPELDFTPELEKNKKSKGNPSNPEDDSPGYNPDSGDSDDNSGPINDKDTIASIFEEVVGSRAENVINSKTHDKFEKTIEQLTDKAVDRMAEQQYFDSFTPEALAEHRNELMTQFDALFEAEDKTQLVSIFEDAGYELSIAEQLSQHKELGLAAFFAIDQSSRMAELSNAIAQANGMANFDTMYDNAPSYSDLVDGTTNAFLNNPDSDPNVAKAKDTMKQAKSDYEESVDDANEAIDTANEQRKKLEEIKAKIIKNSGNDSDKWSEAEVKEYNDAVKEYNAAVKDANDGVAEVESAKTEYEEAVENYETARSEFTQKIKDEFVNRDNDNAGGTTTSGTTNGATTNGTTTNGATTSGGTTTGGATVTGTTADGETVFDNSAEAPSGNVNGSSSVETPTTNSEGLGFGSSAVEPDVIDSTVNSGTTTGSGDTVVSEGGLGFGPSTAASGSVKNGGSGMDAGSLGTPPEVLDAVVSDVTSNSGGATVSSGGLGVGGSTSSETTTKSTNTTTKANEPVTQPDTVYVEPEVTMQQTANGIKPEPSTQGSTTKGNSGTTRVSSSGLGV